MKKPLFALAWAGCLAGVFCARAQEVTNLNHTVVRFSIATQGTNFGTLDFELFDQEKPETVRNFLLYVYSGGYSNLALHRLEPNFVLQAGHVVIDNPTSTNTFDNYTRRATFGPTTNEYGVGPELSNVYGTLAMARVSGQTNSATTDWFINLNTNTFLDSVDGGFTVFGRVVNSTNGSSGTNLLNLFSTFSSTNVTNSISTTFIPQYAEQLTQVPVSFGRDFDLIYADLFVLNPTFLQGERVRETNAPVLTVLPAETNIISTTLVFRFTGTASDDTEVARVIYTTPRGQFVADGRANWTADVRLGDGTNLITFYAVDVLGNRSAGVERTVTNATPIPIAILEPAEAGEVDLSTNSFMIQVSGTTDPFYGATNVVIDTPRERLTATGTTNWTATVKLNPGTNEITAYAVDGSGIFSAGVTRKVFYAAIRAVSLEIQGKGKVTGLTNGQMFPVGARVTVSVVPAGGYYFNGWRGDVFWNFPTMTFTVGEETKIILRLPKTLLGLETGRYEGVFFPSTNSPYNAAGLISLNLRANGLYSGQLKPVGATYSIRGQLNGTGQSFITGYLRTNLLQLYIALSFEGSEALVGYYTDGRFFSPFTLYRVQPYSRTSPAPLAGKYNFHLMPAPEHAFIADGSGFGSVTIDYLGRIKTSGALADGAPFKMRTGYLLKGNRWPIYYWKSKSDAIVGLATFSTNDTVSGDVRWFGTPYLNGTNTNVKLAGSHYTPPANGLPFPWTNGVLTLSSDGMLVPITAPVVVEDSGALTLASNPHNIQLTVTNANGGIKGSFTHPVTSLTVPIKGLVIQSSNTAAGFFPDVPRNGAFELRAAP